MKLTKPQTMNSHLTAEDVIRDLVERLEIKTVCGREIEGLKQGTEMVVVDEGKDIAEGWEKAGKILVGTNYQHEHPDMMRAVAEFFPLLQVGVFPDAVWAVVK